MSGITIDVSEALKKLDPKDIKPAIYATLHSVGDVLLLDIAKYPPALPDSTYKRTGTLGKGWKTAVSQDPLGAVVGNPTAYGPYVQDADKQAAIHRGRWQTTKDVALRKEFTIKLLIQNALAAWAR